jgi:hypothetical protein
MSVSRLSLFVGATLLFASSMEATHEVDHRYLVLGYVRDSAGRPTPRLQVRVVREKTGLVYQAESDADGFYLVVVHLHDGDFGETLRVTVGGATTSIQARWIRARSNPGDAQRHRGTRVDFSGGRARERQELFKETLREYLKQ